MANLVPERLRDMLTLVLSAAGASTANAKSVGTALIDAELAGRSSHGVRLLQSYVDRLRSGDVDGNAIPVVVARTSASLHIDGRRGFGQVVGEFGAIEGTRRAKDVGTCVVTIENSGHLGRNARWAEIAADQGVISIHFGHGFGARASVVPFGAVEAQLGTNPIVLGLPGADGEHIILDFSTAQMSLNTIKTLAEQGSQVEDGVAVTSSGEPCNDPAEIIAGKAGLLPFGGFKGYGLCLFAEALASIAARETFGAHNTNALFSIYIDLSHLLGPDVYETRLRQLVVQIRNAKVACQERPVSLPGDRTRNHRSGGLTKGIELPKATLQVLAAASRSAGCWEQVQMRWPELAA